MVFSFTKDQLVTADLRDAYFSKTPIASLERIFPKTYDLVVSSPDSEVNQLNKIVVAYTLVTLGDHERAKEWRVVANRGKIEVCSIAELPDFCLRLNDPERYKSWTHLTLIIVGLLRAGSLPRQDPEKESESGNLSGKPFRDMSSHRFEISNAILLIYGLLFARLTNCMEKLGNQDRFQVEACFFLAIVSFYSDYVLTQKSERTSRDPGFETIHYWNILYERIDKIYLAEESPYFQLFRLSNPRTVKEGDAQVTAMEILKAFLSQDTITSAQQCIYKHFTSKPNVEQTDIGNIIGCLNSLTSLQPRLNSWLRNKMQWAASATGTVAGSGYRLLLTGIGGYITGEGLRLLLTPSFDLLRPQGGDLLIGIVAFSVGVIIDKAAELMVTKAIDTYKDIKTSAVMAFRKRDLNVTFAEERSSNPAYLEFVGSPDGSFIAVYNVTPLPKVSQISLPNPPTEGLATRLWKGLTFQRGGNLSEASGTKTTLQSLKQMLEAGERREELLPELQRYIIEKEKGKLNLGSTQRGGAKSSELIRKVLDKAKDPAHVRYTHEDTINIVTPHPNLYLEALAKSRLVETPDPSQEVTSAPDSNRLPILKSGKDTVPSHYYPLPERRRQARNKSRSRAPPRRGRSKSRSRKRTRSRSGARRASTRRFYR